MDQILAEEAVDNGSDQMVQWTLTDHLNTVRDIAKYDPAMDSTSIVNHLLYDAFGRVTSESNPAVDSLFLFTARPFDSDSQLQNNLNRWYDPAVGRWLSEDPIGFRALDVNLYRYVANASLVMTDPTAFLPIICSCDAYNVQTRRWFTFDVAADWCNGTVRDTCSAACQVDPHYPGAPILIQFAGRWRYKHSPRHSVDVDSICAELEKHSTCAKRGCTAECCRSTLSTLLELAMTFEAPRGRDECFRWVSYFPIGQLAPGSGNCFMLTDVRFRYPIGVPFTQWFLHHCAKRVTLCDGSWFYIDNGWWGGTDGVFVEDDIPSYAWPNLVF